MKTRTWVRDGVRAILLGWGEFFLALLLNPLLFVFWLVALLLTPVGGVGMALLPLATRAVRARADQARRRATGSGVAIARPYAPRPEKSWPVGWRRYRWILVDPATWRDLAWLVPGMFTGVILGILPFAVALYGLSGILLLPLWLFMGGAWYGYGVYWPTEDLVEAVSALPQGAFFLAAALAIAPLFRWTQGAFDRLFLAPTRAAELRLRVSQLTDSRAGVVDAQAAELRRIERDLHDGAQARIASLGMTIGLAEELLERDPAAARSLLAEARASSGTALAELRSLVRGIHPPVLAERGLDGAVRALALSLPVPTGVDIALPGRPEAPVESAAYFAIAESLANVVRHSGATTAAVAVRHADGWLAMTIADDGTGGADPTRGSGLRGIERRLAAFDGTMTVSSPPGGPTVVTMELPCALSSPRTSPSSGTG